MPHFGQRSSLLLLTTSRCIDAAKHAGASEAHVELSTTGETMTVEIRDNGRGGANLADGSGIRGLADRVEALGGRFELHSPVGAGTVIKAELPLR